MAKGGTKVKSGGSKSSGSRGGAKSGAKASAKASPKAAPRSSGKTSARASPAASRASPPTVRISPTVTTSKPPQPPPPPPPPLAAGGNTTANNTAADNKKLQSARIDSSTKKNPNFVACPSKYDLNEIVFVCIVFTIALIVVQQLCRVLSSAFVCRREPSITAVPMDTPIEYRQDEPDTDCSYRL